MWTAPYSHVAHPTLPRLRGCRQSPDGLRPLHALSRFRAEKGRAKTRGHAWCASGWTEREMRTGRFAGLSAWMPVTPPPPFMVCARWRESAGLPAGVSPCTWRGRAQVRERRTAAWKLSRSGTAGRDDGTGSRSVGRQHSGLTTFPRNHLLAVWVSSFKLLLLLCCNVTRV
jgi:hypothetical protein